MVYAVLEMDCNCTKEAAKEVCSIDKGVWGRVVPLQLWRIFFHIIKT